MASVSAIGPGAPPQRAQPVVPQRREAPPPLDSGTAPGVAAGVTGSTRPGFGAAAGAALLEAQAVTPRPATPPPRPDATPPAARAPREASPEAAGATPRGPTAAAQPGQQDQAVRDTEARRHKPEARAAEPPGRGEQERAAALAAYAARGDWVAGAPAVRLTG